MATVPDTDYHVEVRPVAIPGDGGVQVSVRRLEADTTCLTPLSVPSYRTFGTLAAALAYLEQLALQWMEETARPEGRAQQDASVRQPAGAE